MISISSQTLIELVTGFLWPLTRILGVLAIAPPFGNSTIPMRIKLMLGVSVAMVVSPMLPKMPEVDPVSLSGMVITAQQLVIGLAMGFVMRVVFAGIEMAGEIAGMTMGLGFATFFDPQTHGRSSAIAQFLVLTSTLLFVVADGHLAIITAIVESFQKIPVTTDVRQGFAFYRLAVWGEQIFIAGVKLSLPIVAALLITNIALGILTRAAPQLNIFGIGFPITISVGFLVLTLLMPYLTTPVQQLIGSGLSHMSDGGNPRIANQPPPPPKP